MNCPNCGNTLEENAKFCQKCGNPVSAPDMNASQHPVNMATPMQQPVYGTNPATTIPKKNNIITIALGVVVVVLALILISMQSKISNLENELVRTRNEMEDYENRNAVEKSIDAIGSWLE